MADNKKETKEQGAYLVINNQVFPLNKDRVTIGRKLDNDLVIQDPLVSRNHAAIHAEHGKFIIYDLESTGGTYLNNKKIDQSALYSGDIILLANVALMFVNDTNISSRSDKTTGRLADKL